MIQQNNPNEGENKESKTTGMEGAEKAPDKFPFQKVEMRTMNSDESSIKSSGGGAPSPYTPSGQGNVPKPQNTPSYGGSQFQKIPPKAPNYPQGENTSQRGPSFNTTDMSTPESSPTQNTQMSDSPKKGSGKLFFWIIIGIVVLFIAAAIYFFLIPALQGMKEIKEETTETTEQVVVETPKPQTNEMGNVVTPQTIAVHATFLKSPADITSEIRPVAFSAMGVKSAIQPTSTTVPLFKELIIKTDDNKPISLNTFSSMFFPTFFTSEMILNFESDFTFTSYTNEDGTWLGLALKLKDSSDISFVQSEMNKFQSEPGIKDFYLSNPGNQLEWKDGKINGKAASVLEFSIRGIEFTYVWFDRYLVISSNLKSAGEIGKRLGF